VEGAHLLVPLRPADTACCRYKKRIPAKIRWIKSPRSIGEQILETNAKGVVRSPLAAEIESAHGKVYVLFSLSRSLRCCPLLSFGLPPSRTSLCVAAPNQNRTSGAGEKRHCELVVPADVPGEAGGDSRRDGGVSA
jgi:hypothetical protein